MTEGEKSSRMRSGMFLFALMFTVIFIVVLVTVFLGVYPYHHKVTPLVAFGFFSVIGWMSWALENKILSNRVADIIRGAALVIVIIFIILILIGIVPP